MGCGQLVPTQLCQDRCRSPHADVAFWGSGIRGSSDHSRTTVRPSRRAPRRPPRPRTRRAPRVSWKLPTEATAQHAYQVVAADWDSGRVQSDRSLFVPVGVRAGHRVWRWSGRSGHGPIWVRATGPRSARGNTVCSSRATGPPSGSLRPRPTTLLRSNGRATSSHARYMSRARSPSPGCTPPPTASTRRSSTGNASATPS